MARVYNWQINREMEYPYEVEPPHEQFSAVFDLNKCLGCQTCVVACKTSWTRDEGMEYMWWATVNTQPGKGTPRAIAAPLIALARWPSSELESRRS